MTGLLKDFAKKQNLCDGCKYIDKPSTQFPCVGAVVTISNDFSMFECNEKSIVNCGLKIKPPE